MIGSAKRVTPAVLGLAVLWGAASEPAAAKFKVAYSSGSQYVVEWTQIPDFDQVRADLPNDGKMYCVPTSALNVMAYIARHGYPEVAPGSHSYYWWMGQTPYVGVTANLVTMGFLMGTDAQDGTGGNGGVNGIEAWLPGGFLIYHEWASGFSSPLAKDLGAHMLAGQLVMPAVGWYNEDNFPFISRGGGHVLTLTKVARSGSSIAVSWRDPASEQDDLDTQSLFQSHSYGTESRLVFVDGLPRLMDKIVGYGSAYLDEYFAIFPLCGLTQDEDKLNLKIIHPKSFSDVPHNLYEFVQLPRGLISKSVLHSSGLFMFVLGDDGGIWKYDQVDPLMREIVQIAGAEDFVFSRFGKLYVLVGRTLRCYSIDEDDNVTQEAYILVPENTDTLVADDFADSLLLLDPVSRQILRYDYELTALQETIDVTVPHLRGKGALAASPTDGTLFVTSSDSSVIYELQDVGGGYTPIPFGEGIVSMPRGLNVMDDGEVAVGCEGIVKVFRFVDGTGWQENPEHPFAGLEAGESLSIPRSRTNYDPRIHDGPEYRNELPTEFSPGESDCMADLDEDGDTDQADLGIFLADWGCESADCAGDLDGDGDTDQSDLGILLGDWGCAQP